VLLPGSSSVSSAFPMWKRGSAPSLVRERDFPRAAFRGCSYFVMFKPHSLLASQIAPTSAISLQGGRGFYVRAERASLPPHASDVLPARLQAIGGTRTFTSLDSQPCRLLSWDRNRARR
jgi:hypothetical protein